MPIPIHAPDVKSWSEEKLAKEYAQALRYFAPVSSGLTYNGAEKRNLIIIEAEIARRRVVEDKPTCQLTGKDGNVFSIIANVSRTLNNAGQPALSKEFRKKAFECPSYNAVLNLCSEYVEMK